MNGLLKTCILLASQTAQSWQAWAQLLWTCAVDKRIADSGQFKCFWHVLPVEVAHVATLLDIVLLLLLLPYGFLRQPLLILLQLLLVGSRHKALFVAEEMVLHLPLLCQPAGEWEQHVRYLQMPAAASDTVLFGDLQSRHIIEEQ